GEAIAHAAGQLDHGRLAEQDCARVGEAPDSRSVAVDLLLLENLGAPGRRRPRKGQEILGRVGHAVQRSAPLAGTDVLLGGAGLRERMLGQKRGKCAERWAKPFGALEITFGELDRRQRAALDALAELADGQKENVVAERHHLPFGGRGWSTRAGSSAFSSGNARISSSPCCSSSTALCSSVFCWADSREPRRARIIW